jgi:hypothetical protein
MVCASRPAARLLRTAAPFELPGGYFGTTRPIIRLVVDPITRRVLYYQPKADNPADNPAVSFVVQLEPRLATLDSGQGALLQVMSVGRINTVKPAQ